MAQQNERWSVPSMSVETYFLLYEVLLNFSEHFFPQTIKKKRKKEIDNPTA